mgnify:CR=1 FL=1
MKCLSKGLERKEQCLTDLRPQNNKTSTIQTQTRTQTT